MTDNLKPCPFCGDHAVLDTYYDFYRVRCDYPECPGNVKNGDGIWMMESIEKLRERFARQLASWKMAREDFDEVDAMLDEIEAEIAERYMELPLDADGVPIHVGDELRSDEMGHERFTVDGIGLHDGTAFHGHGVVFHTAGHCLNGWNRFNATLCRHVKPRTLEDVLDEFASAYDRIGGEDDEHWKYLEIVKRYADEIRELLGVSE